MHRTTRRFRKALLGLPETVQLEARKQFVLLKANPRHPSLHFKKTGDWWSVRVGLEHRALAHEDGSDFVWLWIGTHDEYDRMIG